MSKLPENLPKLPYGEGAMSFHKSGKIIYKKSIGSKRKKRVSVYGETVRECLKKMKEEERKYEKEEQLIRLTDEPTSALLQDAMLKWIYTYKYPVLKGTTIDTLDSTYNNYIKDSSLGRMAMNNIFADDIQSFINDISNIKSPSTTKKVHNLLSQFFKYYYAADIVHNPMNIVQLPKKKEEYIMDEDGNIDIQTDELLVLNDDEIERLVKELSQPYVNGRIGYYYGFMLIFILFSFMRYGEVVGLQWKRIDFEKKTAQIYVTYSRVRNRDKNGNWTKGYKWILTTPKTKKSVRVEYLSQRAIDSLIKYREIHPGEDNDFIFRTTYNNPVPAQNLNVTLSKALKRAGIDKHITIHGLRHTGISYYIRHGVSDKVISELAGHSEVSTTNRIYYNVIKEQKEQAFKTIDEINND